MSNKDSVYHPSMYDIYNGERKKVKAEMQLSIIPTFSFEAYRKGVEEVCDLKDEKCRHKNNLNQYEKNEIVKRIINSETPNWGAIKINV